MVPLPGGSIQTFTYNLGETSQGQENVELLKKSLSFTQLKCMHNKVIEI